MAMTALRRAISRANPASHLLNTGRRVVRAIEPWYDLDTTNTWRLDALTFDEACDAEFEVHRVQLQWFGIHLGLCFGRLPSAKAVWPGRFAARKPRRSIAAGISRALDRIEAAVHHPICDAALVALAILSAIMLGAAIWTDGVFSPAGAIVTRIDL